ncbi:beta-lactamase family protein [Kribbella sandramycini]|uniref:Beta-lactamase family protein n=1 Tax=Kribbella sandramycini TaxID=60450 RepID=A0A7Y4L738_9ACTN|nr:serine hydrolase domain-containing protein [Kribbella sandramycini]MBB6568862.1 CubicO group peptidase (beta-lactamase class C family) [Kribbella sandramycini]NOL45630.1 beta-lactamase family protein [Kribbella sandramycini]
MTDLRPDTSAALLAGIAAAQSETRVPSLAAGVVRDGQLVWTGARGRFATAHGLEPGPNVQYRIGSITKTLTAVLVLQCRDEGLLALNDAVGKYLPGIAFGDLTIRNLLAHSGGMNAEPAGPWWERNPGVSFDQLVAAMDESHAAGPADRRHHYSNLGYGLLAEIVARVRGASWLELVQRRILDPLEMRRTSYFPFGAAAQGFSVHPFSGQLVEEPAYDAGAMAPAGQLWSTVEDLSRFARFLIDPVPEVLSRETIEEMAAPAAADPREALTASYGLGLRLIADDPHLLVGHTGSMPGFLAGLFVDRARRIGAITLGNATHGRVASVATDLLTTLVRYEPVLAPEWVPEPELAQGHELLGHWYWGNSPLTFSVVAGILQLSGSMSSRFSPIGPDMYRGRDGYFAGERLRVVRRGDAIDHLDLATFVLTRTPYGE